MYAFLRASGMHSWPINQFLPTATPDPHVTERMQINWTTQDLTMQRGEKRWMAVPRKKLEANK